MSTESLPALLMQTGSLLQALGGQNMQARAMANNWNNCMGKLPWHGFLNKFINYIS